ncbi:hypothetical protein [Microbulbifer hainanensis]|uniref:hypothetical protein n=1 Tax=Microbulbifer hainanensis TaxID=2735675 RepID=UPI001868E029|nr:hypothetical protein [Microbulbifer hainanensis]
MDTNSAKAISLLLELQDKGVLGWPIDLELQKPSEEDGASETKYWFDGDKWKKEKYKIIKFGQDGTGSSYCLWYYPELTGEPPVVFFGSEGELYNVAISVKEFARYLGAGYDFGFGGWFAADEENDPDAIDRMKLQKEIESVYGALEGNPEELHQKLLSAHPSLEEWVDKQVEQYGFSG